MDDAFYQFLAKLFGNSVLTRLREEGMDDYFLLFRDFETKKRTVKPDLDDKVTVTLPLRLLELFKNETDETLEEALPQTRYANTVAYTAGRLRVKPEVFKEFFSDALQGIIQHIREIMGSFPEESLSKILLVGGFSESPMVLKAIRELFPTKKVIAPADPGLAVLKGAVLFGHDPSVICSRISRYSIGLEVNVPFIEGLHPDKYKKRNPDGRAMCQHVFEALVQKGEEVPIGHRIENTYTPSEEDAKTGIGIFQSSSASPTYTTERTCKKLGSIVLRRPNGGWTEDAQIHSVVEFGGTQFQVSLTDDCLDETYKDSFNFLND